jgi:hypothetical protein
LAIYICSNPILKGVIVFDTLFAAVVVRHMVNRPLMLSGLVENLKALSVLNRLPLALG